MARYEKLFDAFGPSAIGQTAAAVVIGALVGLGASRKFESKDAVPVLWFVLGGAGIGLLGAVSLILIEFRRKRVQAGLAKPHGAVFWVLASLIGLVVFLGLCIAFIAI